MKVLLIEDEAIVRWGARRALESLGADVTEADTVARAEVLWQANDFDLVVTDHRLPDGFGAELADRMRRMGRGDPVILLSAETESVAPGGRPAPGLAAVLSKPLDFDALRKTVSDVTSWRTNASPRPAASGESASREPVMAGRFRIVAAGACLNGDCVREIMRDAGDACWVAVDLSAVTNERPSAWPELIAWARSCRERGGRLCVVTTDSDVERALRFYSAHKDLDAVKDRAALAALGRRTTSACERTAVLDSVLREEAP